MAQSDSTARKPVDDQANESDDHHAVENWADQLNDAATSSGGCLETAIAAHRERETTSLTKRGFLRTAAVASVAASGVALPAGAAEANTGTATDAGSASATGPNTPIADDTLVEYALSDERVEEIHVALEAKGWEQERSAATVADESVVIPYDDTAGTGSKRTAVLSWTTSNPPQAYEIDQAREELTTHWYRDGERQTVTATEAELAAQDGEEPAPDSDGLLGYILSLSPVGRAAASSCDPHGPPESATGGSFDCCGTVDRSCIGDHARGGMAGCITCKYDPTRVSCLACAAVLINQGYMSMRDCCSGYWY